MLLEIAKKKNKIKSKRKKKNKRKMKKNQKNQTIKKIILFPLTY